MKARAALLCAVAMALLAVGIFGSSASAAVPPSLGVELSRDSAPDSTPVTHSDERAVYLVTVTNTAGAVASAGESLVCDPRDAWNPVAPNKPTFTFQWLRDGSGLESPTDIANGSRTSTYTVQAADEGHSLQCEVIGTNAAGQAVSVTPPVAVLPLPAPLPSEAQSSAENIRPIVPQFGTGARTCTIPEPRAWSGSPTWSFQWLRNGKPIPGATSAEYTPKEGSGEEDDGKVLQCLVSGVTGSGGPPGGGTVVAVSQDSYVGASTGAPNNNNARSVAELPLVEVSSVTAGTVIAELELPGGLETRAVSIVGSGWACTKAAATVLHKALVRCQRSDSLAPTSSYPTLEVVAQIGHDAPETLMAKATASGGGAPSAATEEDNVTPLPAVPFGFKAFSAKVADESGNDYTQAGGHPFSASATIQFTEHVRSIPNAGVMRAANGLVKEVDTKTPRGFVGNPRAVTEHCKSIADVLARSCPDASVVGGITLETEQNTFENLPVYALEPEFGTPAQFGFGLREPRLAFTLTARLRPAEGYAISLVSTAAPKTPELFGAIATLCSFGGKQRNPPETEFAGCRKPGEAGASKIPLITNSTHCDATGPITQVAADTWEAPGTSVEAEYAGPALTGCGAVRFEPHVSLQPTSQEADSPTGMDVEITMPTNGLEEPKGIAQAPIANATVTLPQGMALNPSLAAGLEACTSAEIQMGTNAEPNCPESSKVGTVQVETPLLNDPLQGNVYVAKQGDNPFGSLLALYLVVTSKRDGITIKIAGRVTPDPLTGQLTASFQENPEAPFSRLSLHFLSGSRAALINPPSCGSYEIASQLVPWSAQDLTNPTAAEVVDSVSSFEVTEGPGGTSCPTGALNPRLDAGLANPTAGTTSPFTLHLWREDGSQRFAGLDVTMPPGLSAYLTGIPYCSEATLAAISSAEGTAAAQLAEPACPAASQIGTVSVGAGAGPLPFYADTGSAYLAGPYKGAPLSIAIVVPAIAGPFDLGNVVVRNAAYVDPETARITVKSDPIPTILHGLLLDVRDIRVSIDRPHFTLSPTNCEPSTLGVQVTGEEGGAGSASTRFQVGGCQHLAFKPNLTLQLKGETKRIGHPALKAVLTYPQGGAYANVASAQVNLPHGEFLDQGNLNKTCTKPVLLAGGCPPSTVYGRAKAWTPLLDKPLEGPVYLVGGYGYKLPALVAELNGQIKVLLVGKVDSGPNKGIRSTFEAVPDAPVEKFVLEMKGGPKYSLLENSENLCKASKAERQAIVSFTGQNGESRTFKPVVSNQCGKQKRRHDGNGRHSQGVSKAQRQGGKKGT